MKAIPPRSHADSCAALEAAMSYVAARGVTKVHTMVTVDCHSGLWPSNLGRDADKEDVELAFKEVELYREFMMQDKLRTRIRAALPVACWRRVMKEILGEPEVTLTNGNHGDNGGCNGDNNGYNGDTNGCNGDTNGYTNGCNGESNGELCGNGVKYRKRRHQMFDNREYLQVGVLKAQMDGSLGTHTAAFYDDFTDTPGYKGDFIWDPAILRDHVVNATTNGLDVCVHAIGDHANTVTLDLFESVAKQLNREEGSVNGELDHARDPRFRIEHAQHVRKCDIPRFGALNVIASMQMSHLADDGCWASKVLGKERMKTSWPMRSLLDGGAVVALGSDWFVAEPSPLQGIYDAVTRRTTDGVWEKGLVEEEKVTVEEALVGYTSGAAYAAHEEDRRGALGVGMLADLVLLDKHILEIPVEDIIRTRVKLTVVGGRVMHDDMLK